MLRFFGEVCMADIRGPRSGLLLMVAIALWSFPAIGTTRAFPQEPDPEYLAELTTGETALKRRQWELALKSFKKANTLNKKPSADALFGVARAYVGLGAFKSAADTCDEAVKVVSGDTRREALLRNLHGISVMALAETGKADDKRLKTAEADFRAALSLDETLVIARYNLATALLRQKRDEDGISELRTFVERAPATMGESAEAKRILENPRRAREPFAPDFSFTSLQGEYFSLEELRGKVVLLDFWATWCPPCVAATPSLIRLNKKYADKPFVMLGISADRDRGVWQQYIEQNKTDWPQYFDPGPLRASFQVNSFPTYILVDHEGVMRERKSGWGSDTAAFLDDQIRKRVKAVPGAGGAEGSDLYFPILARPLTK